MTSCSIIPGPRVAKEKLFSDAKCTVDITQTVLNIDAYYFPSVRDQCVAEVIGGQTVYYKAGCNMDGTMHSQTYVDGTCSVRDSKPLTKYAYGSMCHARTKPFRRMYRFPRVQAGECTKINENVWVKIDWTSGPVCTPGGPCTCLYKYLCRCQCIYLEASLCTRTSESETSTIAPYPTVPDL